jgi:hypothetical protein
MTNKNFKFLIGLIAAGAILSFAGFALISQASPNEHSQKPNIHKPVPATDVELVKKTTLRGGKSAGKGKPTQQAATGVLGEPVSGTKYAIVIGIADYPGTDYDLKYTDEDAEETIQALTNKYGFDGTNIRSFIDKEGQGSVNATRANILLAIQDIENVATPDDEVVFFFSGHGMKGRADDGDREAIDESIVVHDGSNLVPIWDGELKTAFADYKTSRIVFIFDSCVSGGMTDLAAPGRIINMATTETGTAYEFDSLQNGQFTYYFVDAGMLQGLADKYDSISGVPDVTVEEAFDYAKLNCSLQTPTIKDSFENDLLL